MKEAQTTSRVLMVRPGCALANPETADSNAFQARNLEAQLDQVQAEFDHVVNELIQHGIHVMVLQDSAEPEKPDAVFPNNWVSFHGNNAAVTYPMLSPLRRLERRGDALEGRRVLDLTEFETEEQYLEGTGSMVLDRVNKIAYAALSSRTHPVPLEHFCAALGYFPLTFEAIGPDGDPVYHTNVVMSVGETFAVICIGAIPNPNRVLAELKIARKQVIEISAEQMSQFAGNLLQLRSAKGESVIAMSDSAYQALTTDQRLTLEQHGRLLHVPIPTIELLGGGSVRCMIAEVF